MNGFKRVVSIVLVVMLVVTCGMLTVNAVTTDTQEAQAQYILLEQPSHQHQLTDISRP